MTDEACGSGRIVQSDGIGEIESGSISAQAKSVQSAASAAALAAARHGFGCSVLLEGESIEGEDEGVVLKIQVAGGLSC